MASLDGVLLVDKPEGPTSHDVVGFVRWALGCSQVGHCGTLDPLATGLLVVCVGAATRLVPYLTGVDKAYRARFGLGLATTTADREGEVTARCEVSPDQRAAAMDVLRDMCGELRIPPPAFSAVKVDGQRAHARARRGETVELAARSMTLRAVTEIECCDEGIDATCLVSKGTYVRSLAEELGRRTGLPTHLAALRRLACGSHRVDEARVVGDLCAERLPDRPGLPPKCRLGLPGRDGREAAGARLRAALLAPVEALPFPVTRVAEGVEGLLGALRHGRSVTADALAPAPPSFAEGLGTAIRRAASFADGVLVVACLRDGAWWPERLIHTSLFSPEGARTA